MRRPWPSPWRVAKVDPGQWLSKGVSAFEASLRRFVMILQGDQQALHRAQRTDGAQQDKRSPQQGVHPERRLIVDLDDQRGGDDHETSEEHDKYCGPVAGVDKRI